MSVEEPGKPKRPSDRENKPFGGLVDKERVDNFFEYARTHTREMVAYALLVLGIFFLFVAPYLGQALVGIVASVYYGHELIDLITNFQKHQRALGPPRTIVLVGTLVALFIGSPLIFIAGGFTMALKHLLVAGEGREPKP